VCCSVLQYVAACFSCFILVCDWTHSAGRMESVVAVCCNVVQCGAVSCSVLQCLAVFCSVVQCDAVPCNVLQCLAVSCSLVSMPSVLKET